MKKKTKFGDEPIGKLTRVDDFLPPPNELISSGKMVKITITLDEDTLIFFKNEAEKLDAKYQRMMREVLSKYARKYGKVV